MVGIDIDSDSPINLCKACVVCGTRKNVHTCPTCVSVFYCDDPQHEKEDWESHLAFCSPYKIIHGDVWLAARDLPQGLIIFVDTTAGSILNGDSRMKVKDRTRKIMSRKFPYTHSCLPNCRVDIFPKQEEEPAPKPPPQQLKPQRQPKLRRTQNQTQNQNLGQGLLQVQRPTVGTIVVRTILPIRQGDKLTVENHGSRDSDMSIHYRRLLMLDMEVHYADVCSCETRCSDRTENGSLTSALTCSKCFDTWSTGNGNSQNGDENSDSRSDPTLTPSSSFDGYFLPRNPLDFRPNSPWQCISCGEVQTAIKCMARVKSVYDNFLPIWPVKLMDLNLGFQEHLLDQLEKDPIIVGRYGLHPNHWIIVQAYRFLLYKQTVNVETDPIRGIILDGETNLLMEELTPGQLDRLETCVRRREFLLRVNGKRSPGWTKARGKNLWYLWLGKFILANQKFRPPQPPKDGRSMTRDPNLDVDLDQLESALKGTKEALDLLKEAAEIRRFEFNPLDPKSTEQFNIHVAIDLQKTGNWIKSLEKMMDIRIQSAPSLKITSNGQSVHL